MTTSMASAKTKVPRFTGHQVSLLIILAIWASPSCGKMCEAAKNFETRASDATTESWADWVHDKEQRGLWMAAKNMQDIAGEIAMTTKDKVSAYTTGATDQASEMASEPNDPSADDAKASMKSKAFHSKDTMMNNKAGDAKDAFNHQARRYGKRHINCKSGEAQQTIKSRAERVYDEAKKKASEACESAKKSMATGAKRSYEAAKERASKAAGDLGCCNEARRALMRTLILLSLYY